jgi:hypothetical protein
MDFVKAFLNQKHNKKDLIGTIKTTVYFRDNEFYVIVDNKEYSIAYHIQNYTTLYSLPSNTAHPAWTKKNVTNVARPDLVIKSWSAFKPNQRVKGIIKNNKFIINYEKVSKKGINL